MTTLMLMMHSDLNLINDYEYHDKYFKRYQAVL